MGRSFFSVAVVAAFALTACAGSSSRTIPLASANVSHFSPSSGTRAPAFLPITFTINTAADGNPGPKPGVCPGGEDTPHGPDLRWAMCHLTPFAKIVFDTAAMERNSPKHCANGTCRIVLSAPLPPLTNLLGGRDSFTIDGGTLGRVVVDGQNRYRAFWIGGANVTLENLEIDSAAAIGGGGGGGYFSVTRYTPRGREVFPGLAKGGAGGPGGGGGGGGGNVLCRSCFHRDGGLGGKLVDVTGGDGGDDGGGGGAAAIGPVLFNYFGIVEITNSGATGSSATPGRGFASQGGKDGTADATPIFNYGGYVNHDTKQGPISGILLSHAPTAVPGQGP